MGKKITIQGKVHNVGYRLLLLEEADNLFINYFDARNININGRETLVVFIDGEDAQVNEFVDFINSNFPEKAVVKSISVEDFSGKIKDIDKFRQSFDTVQLSKIVQSGIVLLEYAKFIPEIRDNTKFIPEIRDDIKEIKLSSNRTNHLLEEKFEKLENEIQTIKLALVKAGIEV
ncbi:MAG: acylphosphatase [Methanobacteriota archaeon]